MTPQQRKVPHLMPVGQTGIPLADAEIQRTIDTLRVAQFEQDPLFDAADSFELSLRNSAVKREGSILVAAIMDAIGSTSHLRLVPISLGLPRRPDVQFEVSATGLLVALEVKRSSQHDSTKVRQFRADLAALPHLLRTALPLFPGECDFHILFLSGRPPIREGLTPADLSRIYDLHIMSHVLTARQRYSAALKAIQRERGYA